MNYSIELQVKSILAIPQRFCNEIQAEREDYDNCLPYIGLQ